MTARKTIRIAAVETPDEVNGLVDNDYGFLGLVQQERMLVGIPKIVITLPFGGWITYSKTEDRSGERLLLVVFTNGRMDRYG